MSESEARRWLQFAKEDLETAELLLGESRPPRFVAFHAQQAAEKALKAAVVASGATVVHTHDLSELRLLIPTTYEIAQTDADLALLSQLAVEPRYPDTAAAITDSIAETAIEDARKVVDAAERDLEREECGT
jgi:HEPN domain-containing protein